MSTISFLNSGNKLIGLVGYTGRNNGFLCYLALSIILTFIAISFRFNNLQDFFNLIDEMDIPCRLEKPKKAKAAPKPAKEEAPKQQGPKKSFTNMTVVFTGFRNKEWEEMIESNGGNVTTSVSKKTSLVVALNPEDNTGKTAKANDLGVRVISREDFEKEYI